VDDTKFVSKGVLDELFRHLKDLFNSEYGRKVVTYLVAPRDARFFLKDYVRCLEAGDQADTRKKDPELRRKELLDYAKPFLKEFLSEQVVSCLQIKESVFFRLISFIINNSSHMTFLYVLTEL
jgi:pumilio family protein 6